MAGNLAETTTDEEGKVQGVIGRYYSATLSAALVLDGTYGDVLKLDPGGAARDLTLWPVATRKGVVAFIVNAADAAETITVKNVGGDTIGSLAQNKSGFFYCDGSTWVAVCTFTSAA